MSTVLVSLAKATLPGTRPATSKSHSLHTFSDDHYCQFWEPAVYMHATSCIPADIVYGF